MVDDSKILCILNAHRTLITVTLERNPADRRYKHIRVREDDFTLRDFAKNAEVAAIWFAEGYRMGKMIHHG